MSFGIVFFTLNSYLNCFLCIHFCYQRSYYTNNKNIQNASSLSSSVVSCQAGLLLPGCAYGGLPASRLNSPPPPRRPPET